MGRIHCRAGVVVAVAAVAAVVVAGCSAGGAVSGGAASGGAGASVTAAGPGTASYSSLSSPRSAAGATPSTPSSLSTSPLPDGVSPAATANDGVDALTLTGPATAATVPDMQPVVTDPQPHLPATVTDSRGTKVTVTSGKRVIALDLYGTLVDTIIGLGLQDRLVGRAVSDTQSALADLPVVSSGGIELSAEAVLDLDPDVILTNMTIGSNAVYRQLEAAGVAVVRFEQVPTIADIPDIITDVAAVFGMADQAAPLIDHTRQQLDAARQTIAGLATDTPRQPRALVLYVRGSAGLFFILGADYGASDLLDALQLDDVAADHGIDALTPANPEALAALDPEIILTMTKGVESGGGIDALLGRPGIASTTAGQHRRIITADDAQLLSYGPRTPANLVALADVIYEPEQ